MKFNIKPKQTTVKDLEPKFREGFKFTYSAVRDAVLKCELDKNSNSCKRALEDMGIKWIED